MGNVHSGSTLTRTTGALDSFVSELGGDIIYEKSLGSARFLKTVKCRHRNGYVVVKIFIKSDPGLSLRTYLRRLKMERESLLDIANVYNYQSFIETDRAGYMIRQWIASNLYDRISTRPFLSVIEKKWITFQLLNALRDALNRKIPHGDVKSENILVTSWNWVYLSDFASFKPTFLPLDDPSEFSFYFDTSGRRTCYIAPERFYTAATNPEISAKKLAMDENEGKRDGKITEAMDCFSLGCVIAELFLEGAPLFTLSQLFKYREGEYSVDGSLGAIEDHGIRNMIKQMIALDPSARPTFDTILHTSRGTVFAESFYGPVSQVAAPSVDIHMDALPNDSDLRVDRIWMDYGGTTQGGPRAASEDGPALIVLALVTASIRNCSRPSSKVRALDLFLALASQLTDEAKLDRMVPYIVDLLHDDAAIVRGAALRTLIQVLILVTVITPSNAAIFPEYVIPNVRHLAQDAEVSVRCIYAQCITQLADTAVRFLEMGQALKAHGMFKLAHDAHEYDRAYFEVSYDVGLQELQNTIKDHLECLLVDPSSSVKRAVLHNISPLCIFLGRQRTSDVLLSHMITYLNDREWLLRYAFFESIVDVAVCAGGRSLEDYILPLMIQALSDAEESVVAKVLAALTSLCETGLFQKMRIWELVGAALGFLYHPNLWIQQGAATFIASAARHLPPSDVWCILYPSLRPHLKCDVATIDEQSLLTAVKHPLPRRIFDAAVQWAMKADKMSFWRTGQRSGTKVESPRESVISIRKVGSMIARNKSEEDEAQLSKLQQLGMTLEEEGKLLAMKDIIRKLANNLASLESRPNPDAEAEKSLKTIDVTELTKLGVVPQTVFLRNRPSDVAPRSSPITPLSRRSTLDMDGRTPLLSPLHGRRMSGDHGGGAPFEDLRRRLAAKAAPAVGPSRTNVTGVLEVTSEMRSEVSSDHSGRSSPVSFGVSIRGGQRQRGPPSSPILTYDGREAGISNMLELLYMDNNRELQQDFGPKVHEGPVRRRTPARHTFTPRDGTARRAEASLIANLTSHSDAITGLVVSPDHMFFVSSSDDKTVKVWDTARLERNVTSKPRHTYGQHHARVKCLCMLESVHCFASAADDGSLHIVRVHVTQSGALPKYNKLQVIREHRVDHVGEYITCMAHYHTDASSNLVYATTHSVITTLDLRTMQVLQTMENPRHYGPITAMCLDRKRSWMVVGTSTGVLTLWDRRFGLLLKSWHVGMASMGRSVRIHQCAIHPSKGQGKWVMVALEASRLSVGQSSINLIEIWDIEKGVRVETFATRTASSSSEPIEEPHEVMGADADTSPAAAIAALVRSRQLSDGSVVRRARPSSQGTFKEELLPAPAPDVRALVTGVEFGGHSFLYKPEMASSSAGVASTRSSGRGFMITGSENRLIRLWDLGNLQNTTILSGFEAEQEGPSFSTVRESTGSGSAYVETWVALPTSGTQTNRPSERMFLITNHQQNLLKSHQDVITALACIDSPFRGGVVSGDRAGVIKVWRVESAENTGHSF